MPPVIAHTFADAPVFVMLMPLTSLAGTVSTKPSGLIVGSA